MILLMNYIDILFIFQYLSNLILYTVLNKTLYKIVNKYTKAWSPKYWHCWDRYVFVNTGERITSRYTRLSSPVATWTWAGSSARCPARYGDFPLSYRASSPGPGRTRTVAESWKFHFSWPGASPPPSPGPSCSSPFCWWRKLSSSAP